MYFTVPDSWQPRSRRVRRVTRRYSFTRIATPLAIRYRLTVGIDFQITRDLVSGRTERCPETRKTVDSQKIAKREEKRKSLLRHRRKVARLSARPKGPSIGIKKAVYDFSIEA